tara:strand:- start:2506 stop:2664 length:159 start_codon:yes stop_codon:yes gene_type:complete
MPNNRKKKKRRDYNRYKFYYEALNPVSVSPLTNEKISDILMAMWCGKIAINR